MAAVPGMNWLDLKPSSQAPLERADLLLLPPGMVVVVEGIGPAVMDVDRDRDQGPQARFWMPGLWGPGLGGWNPVPASLSRWSRPIRLPRLPRVSFLLTESQVRRREKDVTRRLSRPTWWKEGRWFLGVNRLRSAGAMGLCVAECISAREELLADITADEVRREGFPDWSPGRFVRMFHQSLHVPPEGRVWRLEFRYFQPEERP